MIDPTKITNFNQTDEQLEEVLLFWVLVAGKNASFISKALDKMLNGLDGSTPFEKIRGVGKKKLPVLLKNNGIGCYNNKAKSLWELINSNLNLRTCSIDDLEKVYGIGPKTARCFIIHSRANANCAGLDTHILKFLRGHGHQLAPFFTPTSKVMYKYWEQVFLGFVKDSGKSVAEFDLEIWNRYASKKGIKNG